MEEFNGNSEGDSGGGFARTVLDDGTAVWGIALTIDIVVPESRLLNELGPESVVHSDIARLLEEAYKALEMELADAAHRARLLLGAN